MSHFIIFREKGGERGNLKGGYGSYVEDTQCLAPAMGGSVVHTMSCLS